MIPLSTKLSITVAIGLLLASTAPTRAEDLTAKASAPASMTTISPIFGQLVRFSIPTGFVPAFEKTNGPFYIREAVLKGETTEHWTQMITVTGAEGLAGNAKFTPQAMAASMAGGFKKACPETFVAKSLGAIRLGETDAFVAVAACGKVDASADGHSEAALIVVARGSADAYTVQWAERGASQTTTPVIDDAKWQQRLRDLMPIRVCAIVAGEAAPYPSCLQQK
jgi:hypothetical protein